MCILYMHKIVFNVGTNPYILDIPEWQIKYRKIRVSIFVYQPSITGKQVQIKIYTGKFEKTLDVNRDMMYFKVLAVPSDNALGFINYSNCNDWDYISNDAEQRLTTCRFTFYENDT